MFLLAAILVLATLTILAMGTERPAPRRIPVRVREHLRDGRRR